MLLKLSFPDFWDIFLVFNIFFWKPQCFPISCFSGAVSGMCTGALNAARLKAGHVLAQQPCCQSSRPITLGMTFKVGRRRRTKCPYLLRTSPADEPLYSVCRWVCLCVLWLWPDLVWHKDSCHISNLSHATQRRCQRPGHQETLERTQGIESMRLCVCVCDHAHIRLKEKGGWKTRGGGHVKGIDSEALTNLDGRTHAGMHTLLESSP